MTTAVPTPPRWTAVRGRPGAPGDAADRTWSLVAALVIFLGGALWLAGMARVDRPMTSTVVVLPAFLAVGLLLAAATSRLVPGTAVRGILATGLGLRMVGLWYRYREAADGLIYHAEGIRIADAYRRFDFGVDLGRTVPGTGTIRLITGLVHAVTFDDLLTSYALFTLAAFGGALLFVRALAVAVPEADLRRYAVLVMVWPSLALWPSSLGKEAWMVFGLGLASLGVAHFLAGRAARGALYLAAGLAIIGLVRPHVGLLVVAALAVAGTLRASSSGRARIGVRLLIAFLAVLGGLLLADATAQRFQVDQLGTEEIDATLANTADKTTTGGANFDPVRVRSPVDYPLAVITVLFRPLPSEASGIEGIATSIEGMALAALLALSLRRLQEATRRLRQDPYLLYALVFVATFCYAFAVIGNFGILARQRSQVLPFVFVLVALVPPDRRERWQAFLVRRRERRADASARQRARATDPPAPEPAPVPVGPTRRWAAVEADRPDRSRPAPDIP